MSLRLLPLVWHDLIDFGLSPAVLGLLPEALLFGLIYLPHAYETVRDRLLTL